MLPTFVAVMLLWKEADERSDDRLCLALEWKEVESMLMELEAAFEISSKFKQHWYTSAAKCYFVVVREN